MLHFKNFFRYAKAVNFLTVEGRGKRVEIGPITILAFSIYWKRNIIFPIYNSEIFLSQVPLRHNFMGNTKFILALMVVVLLPNFGVSFSMKSTTNISTDRLALLALKARVNSDLLATNWSTATTICNWVGVTCGSRHHRVIALDLFGMNLYGTIPPDMGNLSFVAFLGIGNNSFHGSLPIELANLRRLKSLLLRNNNFNGEIPSWFGFFSKLQNLSLAGNNFVGDISSSLCSLSKLELLSLYNNNLQGRIPVEIGNLSSLRFLYLGGNQLSGSIPSSVFSISSLQRIALSDNQLIGSIPLNMSFKCQKLEILSLSYNDLEGTILKEIGNLTMLKIIYLGWNNLKGDIPQQIGNLTLLEELAFGENNLTGNLPNLVLLNLGLNSISGHIPPGIFNSSTVTLIDLNSNRLSGCLTWSTGLWLPKLERLLLDINELNGTILTSISNPSKLTTLDLSVNSFSGYIPVDLGNLRDLECLKLHSNNLASTLSSPKLSFLSSVAYCKDLRVLDFSYNPLIDAELPISIGNLSIALQYFYSRGCNIGGNIPEQISNLSNLITLSIGNNQLIGSIPTTIGRLEKLQGLSLEGNKLEGFIPSDLCRLKSVGFLDLTENRLVGPIPACVGDLVSLRVGLSQIDIGKWKVVIHIDCSNNQLSSEIPSSISALEDLAYLSLSRNKLYGSIPELFGGLIGLEFLDLSRNNFSGIIPKSLQKLLYLKYLNVSFNRLHGEIPNEGPFANCSIQSFVGNEALCGAPRLQLPPCTSALSNGLNIAIKVFNLEVKGSFKSFDIECEVLRNIRHRNLVKIISSCCNVDFKALVLEFMPNGSLEKWLYSHNYFLDILHRLNIMIDVASTLEYLHHGQIIPVAHCDLKPNNVLLDEDMVAHLGDFGIAKLLAEEDSTVQTITLATIGYMAPEYGTQGVVSIKGDVYSFGILLIETLIRKKPTGEMFVGEMSLKYWVTKSLPSTLTQVVDANLLSSTNEQEHFAIKDCALSILQLALECSEELPEERIDMKNVVAQLKKIKIKFLKDSKRRA
ncbi:Leucine-rich repeat protein kinase family protein, putative [Theobroma cacao]|uniref:non-specific serine/threonine protein kinase n=1 Tax=Theobroma cacao TaxID=3641 RepID=A0A061F8R5_THECC|nr:Leucine-rich repeat protein kinase family protein, putative [Theobroma cacao]